MSDKTTDGTAAGEDSQGHVPKELRIALVLNGGVSLAVWMGGVVHELNRLRMASRGQGDSKAWTRLLGGEPARSVAIDLIAGTSAGGLNGALLATAIARGTTMPFMRDEWSKLGSLKSGKLTRAEATSDAESILDGDFFAREVRRLLTEGDLTKPVPSGKEECTLLTTATALDPQEVGISMVGGQVLPIRDGRRIYRFTTRHGRDDFAADPPSVTGPLATAMRATASFPGAFDPVLETGELRALRVGTKGTARRWLVDGGVLDNAPFEPLIDELTQRPISGYQERLLLYVTPGVGSIQPTPSGPSARPDLAGVLAGVLGAFREPDQRLDSDRLASTFTAMNLAQSQPHSLVVQLLRQDESVQKLASRVAVAANAMFRQYQAARCEGLERILFERRNGGPALRVQDSVTLRPGDVPGMPSSFRSEDPATWKWGLPTADRVLRWVGRAVSEYGLSIDATAETVVGLDDLCRAVQDAQARIGALKELRDQAIVDATLPPTLTSQLRSLSSFYEANNTEISQTMHCVLQRMVRVSQLDESKVCGFVHGLEVVFCCLNWGADPYDTPRFSYLNLTPDVQPPVDLELTLAGQSDLRDWPHRKLFGERWGHFGAFAWKCGREHDWLWGRLDCISLMADHLANGRISSSDLNSIKRDLVNEILQAELVESGNDSSGGNAADPTPTQSLPIARADVLSQRARFVFQMSAEQLLALMWYGDGEDWDIPPEVRVLVDTVMMFIQRRMEGVKWLGRFRGPITRFGGRRLVSKLNKVATAGMGEINASDDLCATLKNWTVLPEKDGASASGAAS